MRRDTARYRVQDVTNKSSLGENFTLKTAVRADYAYLKAYPGVATRIQKYNPYLRGWIDVDPDEILAAHLPKGRIV